LSSLGKVKVERAKGAEFQMATGTQKQPLIYFDRHLQMHGNKKADNGTHLLKFGDLLAVTNP